MLYFRVSALNGDETSGTAEYHRYFGMRGTSSTAVHLDSSVTATASTYVSHLHYYTCDAQVLSI